jgi:hypothetical protein
MRPFFHQIASGMQLCGLVVAFLGGVRLVRAPSLASRRAVPDVSADRTNYARGLTDFYRIQGALGVLVGLVLVLVPIFAT